MSALPFNQETSPPRRDRAERVARSRLELGRLFERLPPNALEAEMALLGSMLLDHKVITDIVGMLPSAEYFYSESHAAIYNALVEVWDRHQSGDLVQITEALKAKGVLEQIGGGEYLLELASGVPAAANAPHYAKIVRETGRLRQVISAAGEIIFKAYNAEGVATEGAQEVLDFAQQLIFDIADKGTGLSSESLSALLEQTLNMLDALHLSGRTITGVATGFYDLDEMTSGLQPGELIIVAARPSMGKTAFALNLAEQVAFAGQPHGEHGSTTPVGFFSMEMSRQSVTQRLLCAHSGVDSHRMRKNMLSHDDFKALAMSGGQLAQAPMYIDDTPGLTVLMLRAKARRMVAQHQVKCIMIDYLQLMTAPGAARESRQAEVSAISRGIKALARELNIPIVCLAQLNRGAEQREGHRPRMADLRESGSIEQDADVIMLLHREEYYHQHEPGWAEENPDKIGVAEVIIAKQRNGPTGTVELTWHAPTTRFKNLHRSGGNFGGGGGGGGGSYAASAGARAPKLVGGGDFPNSPPSSPPASTGSYSFAPGRKSGPEQGFRDGGGPDRDAPAPWESESIDDLPT